MAKSTKDISTLNLKSTVSIISENEKSNKNSIHIRKHIK